MDALAAGLDAILVDNGGSWRPLTELMGGVYIPVNLRASICPFPSYEGAVDPANGELYKDEIASIVNFIDLRHGPGTDRIRHRDDRCRSPRRPRRLRASAAAVPVGTR